MQGCREKKRREEPEAESRIPLLHSALLMREERRGEARRSKDRQGKARQGEAKHGSRGDLNLLI